MRPETTIHSEQCRLFVHGDAGRAAGCGEGKFAVCLNLMFIQPCYSDYNALRGSLLNSTIHGELRPPSITLVHCLSPRHQESPLFQSLLVVYLYSCSQYRAWCCEFLLCPFSL